MSRKTVITVTGIGIVFVIVIAFFFRQAIIQNISRPAVEAEKKVWQEKTSKLEEEVNTLKDELKKAEPVVPQEKIAEAFGEMPLSASQVQEERCGELKIRMLNFFNYIDQKGYLKGLAIEGTAYDHFKNVASVLEKSRPLISGETQDMYTLMRNISHFYRVLGKKDIKLIKAIITTETDIIEPTLQLYYECASPWGACGALGAISMSPEALYDYASFFLTTIAGNSYLARRDISLRTLVRYYCVLIMDKANERGLNKYGIDIRPHIVAVVNDIEDQRGLLYRKEYLNTLTEVQKKYQNYGIIR